MPIDVAQLLHEKSLILPVPLKTTTPFNDLQHLNADTIAQHKRKQDARPWPKREQPKSLRIVWAGRWEYDKGPQQLQAILRELRRQNVDFKLCLLGQAFRHQPPEFEAIKN